jgi:uroporphyrinogen-III synthase
VALRTLIVTRPGAAGRALTDELMRRGQPSLWLPAFEFGGPPDEAQARALLARLAEFDLAIFVSPQAVRATAPLLAGPWPQGTAIAAVGAGTCAALPALTGATGARVIAPAGDEGGSGSEALWPLLQAMRPPPRRVLLLRAGSGREWLGQQLAAAGTEVTTLAVYTRLPPVVTDELRSRLAALAAEGGLASVVTSSDAVTALTALVSSQPQVLSALREGPALASHPRIAARLREAGFARVVECLLDAAAIAAALRGSDG